MRHSVTATPRCGGAALLMRRLVVAGQVFNRHAVALGDDLLVLPWLKIRKLLLQLLQGRSGAVTRVLGGFLLHAESAHHGLQSGQLPRQLIFRRYALTAVFAVSFG